jgi:hypothetical protein
MHASSFLENSSIVRSSGQGNCERHSGTYNLLGTKPATAQAMQDGEGCATITKERSSFLDLPHEDDASATLDTVLNRYPRLEGLLQNLEKLQTLQTPQHATEPDVTARDSPERGRGSDLTWQESSAINERLYVATLSAEITRYEAAQPPSISKTFMTNAMPGNDESYGQPCTCTVPHRH